MTNTEYQDKSVNIVTLSQEQFEQKEKSASSQLSSPLPSKTVTVNVNLSKNTTITFENSNPENSVAQIIATLGRLCR